MAWDGEEGRSMRGVDANGFASWLSSDWMWVATASSLALMMFRRRGHHRSDGYGNCGSFAGSSDEEAGSPGQSPRTAAKRRAPLVLLGKRKA